MQLKDIPLKRVTFNRGDSPHPSMLVFIDEKWERFHHGVGVELSEAELAQIPKSYIESGLLIVEDVTRTVVAK